MFPKVPQSSLGILRVPQFPKDPGWKFVKIKKKSLKPPVFWCVFYCEDDLPILIYFKGLFGEENSAANFLKGTVRIYVYYILEHMYTIHLYVIPKKSDQFRSLLKSYSCWWLGSKLVFRVSHFETCPYYGWWMTGFEKYQMVNLLLKHNESTSTFDQKRVPWCSSNCEILKP